MPVIRSAEVQPHHMHGSTFTPLVRPSAGSSELCVWRLEIASGTQGVPHKILREEAFVLLEGAVSITIAGETSALAPGDAAVAPAGSTICLSNSSDLPSVVLVTAPVGFTGELADGTVVDPPWVN